MIKHLEIKTYESYGIKVAVLIDYDRGIISLVEKTYEGQNFTPKKFVFAERQITFMNGWKNILNAMRFAVEGAEKELTDYEKNKEFLNSEKRKGMIKIAVDALNLADKKLFEAENKKKDSNNSPAKRKRRK